MEKEDIEKTLRQLNRIQPDPERARLARARLLASAPQQFPKLTLRAFLFGALKSGSAIAVTGLLLFAAIGGFSLWKFLEPVIGLDPRALRVEAEAIDIQIHLADLQYQDAVSGRQALVAPVPGIKTAAVISSLPKPTSTSTPAAVSTATSSATSTSPTSTPSSTAIGVGEALQILSR